MPAILGISAYYHDSAAALVADGQIAAAAQEERFSRLKHDARFPRRAVAWCLEEAGLRADQLDYVVFYEKPLVKFERLLETWLAVAPAGFRAFARGVPDWLRDKLRLERVIRRELGGGYRKRVLFVEHHEAHAASAFFPSPFDEAAVLTLDGVGEWATAAFGVGRGGRIRLLGELRFPHSLGLLYSAFTTYCGFRVNSGEHKLMGLAPFGRPKYADAILEKLVDLRPDGSLKLDMAYFAYCRGRRMTSRKFHRLFGGPPRRPEGPITEREMDLAASIQRVAEEVVLRAARHVRRQTGLDDLCLAGGVALNCVANGRLAREGPFSRIWVQPAAGDSGGALGAALLVWRQLLGGGRGAPPGRDAQQASLLGPRFSPERIQAALQQRGLPYEAIREEDRLCRHVAAQLAAGRIVGWFWGRMEFGPRALGARSILADPRRPEMPRRLNEQVKFREPFRPFAPAVLAERAREYFDLTPLPESPYMLFAAPVAASKRVAVSGSPASGLAQLDQIRSVIPAVTHVDGSARVQTVHAERHGRFHRLLRAFEALTGCPVLLNTSFNVRGEPIVCAPEEAIDGFLETGIDVLVLEDYVVDKRRTPQPAPEAARRRFALD